jgi:hypothetical protein
MLRRFSGALMDAALLEKSGSFLLTARLFCFSQLRQPAIHKIRGV